MILLVLNNWKSSATIDIFNRTIVYILDSTLAFLIKLNFLN